MAKTIIALWGMARPLIMVSVLLVYINGLLIAHAEGFNMQWGSIVWGGLVLLLVSLSIHYANEYADYETDALTQPTMYSGGSGVLARGDIPRRLALQAAWVTLGIGFGLALMGYASGNLSSVTILLLFLGTLLGWMYSLPPLKLAWRGWGELDNAILGGIFLHLYGYAVLSEGITWQVVLMCVPFTLLTFNNLLATTWADKVADAQVGKYTLATQYTPKMLRGLYRVVAMSAFGLLLLLHDVLLPPLVVYASLLALPMVVWGWWTYTRIHNPYPTSNAMVVLLVAQMVAWYFVP